MVEPVFAPIWSPVGILQRARRLLRQPGDIILILRIGWFVWRLPHRLRKQPLPRLLDGIRAASRPRAADVASGVERIIRLRTPWLRRYRFGTHNTCYVRALSLYRFLDAGEGELRIHFVVEPARTTGAQIRGHAWVSVDGQMLEEPGRLRIGGRTREVYSHPPRKLDATSNAVITTPDIGGDDDQTDVGIRAR